MLTDKGWISFLQLSVVEYINHSTGQAPCTGIVDQHKTKQIQYHLLSVYICLSVIYLSIICLMCLCLCVCLFFLSFFVLLMFCLFAFCGIFVFERVKEHKVEWIGGGRSWCSGKHDKNVLFGKEDDRASNTVLSPQLQVPKSRLQGNILETSTDALLILNIKLSSSCHIKYDPLNLLVLISCHRVFIDSSHFQIVHNMTTSWWRKDI